MMLQKVSVNQKGRTLVLILCHRSDQLFVLAYSLGKILEYQNGVTTVQAFAQLMEDYEYYFSPGIQQNMVSMF